MDNPWKCIDQAAKLTATIDYNAQSFEDNFESIAQNITSTTLPSFPSTKSTAFKPLPDSSAYLATLEKKLSKLTTKLTVHSKAERRDLLDSLSGARAGHIERLLTSEFSEQVTLNDDDDESVEETVAGSVIRHIAPHLQAVSAVELVHLLQADHLEKAYTPEETGSETNLHPTQPITEKEK